MATLNGTTHLYISTDGTSWILYCHECRIGPYSAIVYHSTDGGSAWSNTSTNLPGTTHLTGINFVSD